IGIRTKDKTRFSRAVIFYPEEPWPISDQHLIDYIAENLDIRYDVISNLVNDWQNFTAKITMRNVGTRDLSYGNWELYFYSIRLIQPNDFPYRHGHLLQDCNMRVYHVGGFLLKLTPASRHFSLKSHANSICTLVAKYWQSARTDCMPNWYVTAEGMQAKDIKSTQNEALTYVGPFITPAQYRRYPEDTYHPYTPEERYNLNEALTVPGINSKRIIPTPVNISLKASSVTIDPSWVVLNSTKCNRGIRLISELFGATIGSIKPPSKFIEIKTVNNLNILGMKETLDEAYWIDITKSSVTISVRTPMGVFYAYQSLRSLTNGGKILPLGVIRDQPRFEYRGMHVDVGRNFHSKEDIMKILDAMAMYKLNKFHFHLTEDEGWRVEIPGLPELTEVASKRCHDPMEDECIFPQLGSGSGQSGLGSGFYTVEDYKEILRFANDRHIEVIPEIDMPGHCRAGIKAMEARFRKYMKFGNKTAAREYLMTDFPDKTEYLSVQMFTDNAINPCMDSTFAFIKQVIRAFKFMHADIQPLKMYHFGGDEIAGAWKDSPECQRFLSKSGLKNVGELKKYFAHMMARITDNYGLNVAAWGDGLKDGPKPYDPSEFPTKRDITAYNWENVWEWGQGDKAYKLANAGYKVVLGHATHLYFDHPYEPDPEERGFYWATRFTDTRKTFDFVPSNIYYNADKAGNGKPLTPDQICTNNGTCLQLTKPENIIGMQGHIWTETVRTADQLQEMVFPRLIALAEKAWHKSSWENIENKDERIRKTNEEWTSFAMALVEKELRRLENMGIGYHIPVPGARMINKNIHVNTALPGLSVQYSSDNKQTWKDFPLRNKISALPMGKEIFFRTKSVDGSRYSRVVSFRP
ncbi:beta-hexosaminidase-like, partial [Saccostrea cucullata]|uniref:beta-hexosaminidase-like n=1 Tax=Saccostrea cuccullata TaxID=36930 RepID=UPI002ED26A60